MKISPMSREGEARFAELLREREADATSPEPIVLMTTLRYDPHLKHLTRRMPIAMEDSDDDVFFLSKLHHQRLKYGAKLLGWHDTRISHTQMVAKMQEAVAGTSGPQRVRVTLNRGGHFEAQAFEVPERDNLFSGLSVTPVENEFDPVFTVVLDSAAVAPAVTNMVKTTERGLYEEASRRGSVEPPSLANRTQPRESVLVGTDGQLLEGTMTSIAVQRNGEWITPRLNKGGMVGVLRSFLLELGFVKEGDIFAGDIADGDDVLVFNGVQGVCAGKFSIP